jgi:hypothetical protein
MSTRQRVLIALGGKCRWCPSSERLEIDHIFGEGNTHRAHIHTSLATWLLRQYEATGTWPLGFQLLCWRCHNIKSRRTCRMSPAKNKTSLNITFPDELNQALLSLAGSPDFDGSKSKVLETAFRQYVEGGIHASAMGNMHQHLSESEARLQEGLMNMTIILSTLQTTLERLIAAMATLDNRVGSVERQNALRHEDIVKAYDSLRTALEAKSGGIFGRLR